MYLLLIMVSCTLAQLVDNTTVADGQICESNNGCQSACCDFNIQFEDAQIYDPAKQYSKEELDEIDLMIKRSKKNKQVSISEWNYLIEELDILIGSDQRSYRPQMTSQALNTTGMSKKELMKINTEETVFIVDYSQMVCQANTTSCPNSGSGKMPVQIIAFLIGGPIFCIVILCIVSLSLSYCACCGCQKMQAKGAVYRLERRLRRLEREKFWSCGTACCIDQRIANCKKMLAEAEANLAKLENPGYAEVQLTNQTIPSQNTTQNEAVTSQQVPTQNLMYQNQNMPQNGMYQNQNMPQNGMYQNQNMPQNTFIPRQVPNQNVIVPLQAPGQIPQMQGYDNGMDLVRKQ